MIFGPKEFQLVLLAFKKESWVFDSWRITGFWGISLGKYWSFGLHRWKNTKEE